MLKSFIVLRQIFIQFRKQLNLNMAQSCKNFKTAKQIEMKLINLHIAVKAVLCVLLLNLTSIIDANIHTIVLYKQFLFLL